LCYYNSARVHLFVIDVCVLIYPRLRSARTKLATEGPPLAGLFDSMGDIHDSLA
jgi:hypothetical protein